MWRGGCIIRSVFLGKIKEAFDRNPRLTNLLVDPYFAAEVERAEPGCRLPQQAVGLPLRIIEHAEAHPFEVGNALRR